MNFYLHSKGSIYDNDYGWNLDEYGVGRDTCPSTPDIPAGLSKEIILCFLIPKTHSENFKLKVLDSSKDYCGVCEYCTCTSSTASLKNPINPAEQAAAEADTETVQQENGGCGPGTVLVNGVCELKQEVKAEQAQTSGGCGEGTVMVNGVCQLADNSVSDAASVAAIGLLVVIGIPVIIIIVIVILIKRRKNTPELVKQKPKKEIQKKGTAPFCSQCGTQYRTDAKFCGGCGAPRS